MREPFSWARLGRPDFRRSCLIVENFLPHHLRPFFPPKAHTLLAWFLFLFWIHGSRQRRGPYRGVHPKQSWLAQRCGYGRRWTKKLIRRFKDVGVLDEGYRSFWKGRFSVSVYFPGGVLFRMLHSALRTKGKARPRHDPLEAAFEHFLDARRPSQQSHRK